MDTPFWRANKELHLSDNIREKMDTYLAGLPVSLSDSDESSYYSNFENEFKNFWTNGSYYSIFGGLGLLPKRPMPALMHKKDSLAKAEPLFAEVKRRQRELLATLPTTYEYLKHLHAA
jgi:tryptophan halogenase